MRDFRMKAKESEYIFCKASLDEKIEIEQVYADNWRRLQLFDDKLFQYYYGDKEEVNFIIARKKSNQEICAGVGYIKCSEKEGWTSALFVKRGESFTLLPQLLNHIISQYEFTYMADLADLEHTKPIYETLLRYSVKEMKHYYKLFDWSEYHIADISKKTVSAQMNVKYPVFAIKTKEQLRKSVTEEILRKQHPYKSIDYLIKRYFDFPYPQYQYHIWGIRVNETEFTTFIVMREQQIGDRRIGRIVDIVGSEAELPGAAAFLEEMGKERKYEYIDCFCYGISDEVMRQTGFVLNEGEVNIIPNRLEPLVKENDKIFFAAPKLKDIRVFHADSDMDRPNLFFY